MNAGKPCALVSAGCLTKTTHRGLQQQKCFLQLWRLGSPRSKCRQIRFLVRLLLPDLLPSPCVLTGQREEWALGCLIRCQRLILPNPGSTFKTTFHLNHLHKSLIFKSQWCSRASTHEFGGHIIQCLAHLMHRFPEVFWPSERSLSRGATWFCKSTYHAVCVAFTLHFITAGAHGIFSYSGDVYWGQNTIVTQGQQSCCGWGTKWSSSNKLI